LEEAKGALEEAFPSKELLLLRLTVGVYRF
jgi:hypothetical protein